MVMDSLDDNPDLQDVSPLEKFVNTHNGGEDMGIFKKIFGSVKKEVAGDASVVSALLQSIAVGADPEIQVQKVRDIVGDSNETFNTYLDELSQAKAEKPETIVKAVNIVDDYYRTHLAGDEEESEGKEKPAEGEGKPEGKEKPTEGEKKPAGDEEGKEKPEDKKNASAGDTIDYDLLADKVAAKLSAKQEPAASAGDEFSMPTGGDAKLEVRGSDDFLNDIWG